MSSLIEEIRRDVAIMLKGIERYNPDNLPTLEKYVELQAQENSYDLEANLATLKLYQMHPLQCDKTSLPIICKILLKALTNFPHSDFILCKCLLSEKLCYEEPIKNIILLAGLLESCNFQAFWMTLPTMDSLSGYIASINGFQDSIRKFVCHVVGITFQTIQRPLLSKLLGNIDDMTMKQWLNSYGWKEEANNMIFIVNQDENIKTKNITEKIDFETVAGIMAACR